MKYNQLDIKPRKKDSRPGRGIAAGRGKTAGRGTKGQNSRTGGGVRPGFEGGQNPLINRLPKLRGFRSHRDKAQVVYTGQLDQVTGKLVDSKALLEAGLIKDAYHTIKLIRKGDVTTAKEVKLPFASKTAIELVQKAGGSYEQVTRSQRTAVEKSTKTA